MKKMIVVLFMFFLLISNAGCENTFTLTDYVNGEYTVYTKDKVKDDSIFLGTCYMTKNLKNTKDKVGESVKITNTEVVQLLNDLDAEVIKTEYLDCGAVVISAYTSKIGEQIEIDNTCVNLQIAVYDDYSIIGWPTILGSF